MEEHVADGHPAGPLISFTILYLVLLPVCFSLLHSRGALIHACLLLLTLPRMQPPFKNAGLSHFAFIGPAVPSPNPRMRIYSFIFSHQRLSTWFAL